MIWLKLRNKTTIQEDTERGHTRHRTWAYKTQNEDKKAKDNTQHNKLNSWATQARPNTRVNPGARDWLAAPASYKTPVVLLI